MSIELWFAFVAASAVLLIIPGPTILTVISYSMAHGRRANLPLVAAVALGDSTALVVSLLGLGALLATSAFWFTVVKWAGGLYLLYLGIKLFVNRAGHSSRAGLTMEAVREHVPRHGPQSKGHRVLRGLPASVHQLECGGHAAALGTRRHVCSHGHAQRNAVRRVRRLGAEGAVFIESAAAVQSDRWLTLVRRGCVGAAGQTCGVTARD